VTDIVVANQPSSLEAVEDQCLMVESWAESCDSIPQLRDASNKLAAISEYLAATSTAGRGRVAEAQRRLEARIGQLLPNEQGRRADRELLHRDEEVLSPQQRSAFRAMAADPETVEAVIAASTDDQPASRRQVIEAIKKKKKESAVPAALDNSREAVAARLAEAERLAANGCSSAQIAAQLGYTLRSFASFKARNGLTVPADAVVGNTRHLNYDRIVNETTTALEGLCIGLGLVGHPEEADLDPDQIAGWATSMNNSLRILNRFSKQLKEMAQ
jgi:hypothetical protein